MLQAIYGETLAILEGICEDLLESPLVGMATCWPMPNLYHRTFERCHGSLAATVLKSPGSYIDSKLLLRGRRRLFHLQRDFRTLVS